MSAEYEKASHCCQKCLNILKNFKNKEHQLTLAEKLENEIDGARGQ